MKEKPYGAYLREVSVGMLLAWTRFGWYWDGRVIKDALWTLWVCGMLVVTPFLLPMAPVVALMCRKSDRLTRRAVEKANEEARTRVHVWGPGDTR